MRQLDKGEISSVKVEKFVENLKNIYEEVRKHNIKMNIVKNIRGVTKRAGVNQLPLK